MSARPAPLPPLPRWLDRTLALGPVLVALLWLAGIARFRHYPLQPIEWAAITASAFALHLLVQRFVRPRPLPPLPPHTNPRTLAALAAAVLAVCAAVLGGVLEAVVEPNRPSEVPWWLRTTWHAACTFGFGYCGFLRRLHQALARPGR
ncbi:MAG: hypothetical protein MUC36_27675 [Planctomycetes bacterium]|nr:hypothetical protein [Planctomycetota bacterium]